MDTNGSSTSSILMLSSLSIFHWVARTILVEMFAAHLDLVAVGGKDLLSNYLQGLNCILW